MAASELKSNISNVNLNKNRNKLFFYFDNSHSNMPKHFCACVGTCACDGTPPEKACKIGFLIYNSMKFGLYRRWRV